ncbi:MAG TPA: hypothetical protein VG844_01825 [Terracidiphilus sp.]|nr:hypothetical protein [Terracidiphilus sp.]
MYGVALSGDYLCSYFGDISERLDAERPEYVHLRTPGGEPVKRTGNNFRGRFASSVLRICEGNWRLSKIGTEPLTVRQYCYLNVCDLNGQNGKQPLAGLCFLFCCFDLWGGSIRLFDTVENHNASTWLRDPDHLFECTGWIGKVTHASDMKNPVKYLGAKWKARGYSLEEMRGATHCGKIFFTHMQHIEGNIEPEDFDIFRDVGNCDTCPNAHFEQTHSWLQIELFDSCFSQVFPYFSSGLDQLKPIVDIGQPIVTPHGTETGTGHGTDKQGNLFANGKDTACCGIPQVAAIPFQRVSRVGVAQQR